MNERKTTVQAIVAHPIPAEQARIASVLEKDGRFHVSFTTHDGLECLRQVSLNQPALLILDAVLDRVSGLEVLRRLRELSGPKPRCLMLTSYGNYVQDYARRSGADYCLIEPYSDKALTDSVHMLVQSLPVFFTDREIDAATIRALRELNVPVRLKGYRYVKDSVRLLIRDPDLVHRRCVVSDLYCVIAVKYGFKNAQPIERAMRTLVDHVFKRSNSVYLAKYFGETEVRQSHATNTDFLLALAQFVRTVLESGQTDLADDIQS